MAEYIEREALKEHIASYAGMFTDELGFVVNLQAVLNGIDFQPVADVVEVVRCRDCARAKEQFEAMYCEVWKLYNTDGKNGFCNYGVRKGNG